MENNTNNIVNTIHIEHNTNITINAINIAIILLMAMLKSHTM